MPHIGLSHVDFSYPIFELTLSPGANGAADLAAVVRDATEALDAYEYTRALDRTEAFFWAFCDDYLELAKSRRYGDHGEGGAMSANTAMQTTLSVLLRLFAPYVPFVTEEAWSWWHSGSVHRAAWPTAAEIDVLLGVTPASAEALRVAQDVLAALRRAKSEAKVGMKAAIARAEVRDTGERLAQLETVRADVCAAGGVQELVTAPGEALAVSVVFAEPPGAQA